MLEPLVGRAMDAMRAEHARDASVALRAAKRVSGLSREDLQERIAEDRRLVSLLARVLLQQE